MVEHDLINDNPQLKKPVLAVLAQLGDAEEPCRRADVERELAQSWDASYVRTPTATIDILVRRGALAEQVYVDGEPYKGTLQDVQTDESVADDAEAYETLAITEKGRALAEAHRPDATLRALLDEHPEYADVFSAVLWAASAQDGCSRADLEREINAFPQLKPDAESGRTRVYPQYFIDALETAGGIEWRQGAWRTTDAGKALL